MSMGMSFTFFFIKTYMLMTSSSLISSKKSRRHNPSLHIYHLVSENMKIDRSILPLISPRALHQMRQQSLCWTSRWRMIIYQCCSTIEPSPPGAAFPVPNNWRGSTRWSQRPRLFLPRMHVIQKFSKIYGILINKNISLHIGR